MATTLTTREVSGTGATVKTSGPLSNSELDNNFLSLNDNKLELSGGTITGGLTINGDLTVNGTTVTVSATNLAIEDNMVYLNEGSSITNPDLGFSGNYNDGTYAHAGFFRDASDGRWKVFDGYVPEPDDAAYIDTSHATFNLASIQASTFYGALSGNAATATILQTARTIQLSGDLSGSASFNGSQDITISAAIQPNSVTLGTDTTGNYVVDVAGGTDISVSHTPGEGSTPTVNNTSTLASVTSRGSTTTSTIGHGGLVMSAGTNVDQLYTATADLTLTTSWQDTGVNAAELATGSYIVQVSNVTDYAVGGGHYYEYYTGVMSWWAGDPNSTIADEIILHRAGHAPGAGAIFLRVQRTPAADTDDLKLQIAGTTNNTGSYTYTFKFRRLI